MSGYEDPNCLVCGKLYSGRTEPGVQEEVRGVGVCPDCRAKVERFAEAESRLYKIQEQMAYERRATELRIKPMMDQMVALVAMQSPAPLILPVEPCDPALREALADERALADRLARELGAWVDEDESLALAEWRKAREGQR